jgi:hypothetical protein
MTGHAWPRLGLCIAMVAVGTRISPRPPQRFRRALLTHRAPPSGSGVEAVTRQRVYSSDWRKEAGDELDEPLPAEACRLAAPLERCEPEPLHLVEEPPQARVVSHPCICLSRLVSPSCTIRRAGEPDARYNRARPSARQIRRASFRSRRPFWSRTRSPEEGPRPGRISASR